METKNLLNKKITQWLLLVAMLVGCSANAFSKTLYLKTNSNWDASSAWSAAYMFGNGDKWYKMTYDSGLDAYKVDVDDKYPNVIFCRMNPASQELSWNNRWNQTGNLNVSDGNMYTITSCCGSISGSWSTYTPPAPNWTLTGSFNDWDITSNVFSSGTTSVNLSANTTYEFKVTKGGTYYGNNGTMNRKNCSGWTMSSSENSNCKITADIAGTYTFTWDETNKKLSVTYPIPSTLHVAGNGSSGKGSWCCGKQWQNNQCAMTDRTITFSNVPADNDLEFQITNGSWDWKSYTWDGDDSEMNGATANQYGDDKIKIQTTKVQNITISYNDNSTIHIKCEDACTTPTKSQYTMESQTVDFDGNAHKPEITVASGAGDVSKIYGSLDDGATWTDYGTSGPTNVGVYKIKIDCNAGGTYCAANGIELDNTFTINSIPVVTEYYAVGEAIDGTTTYNTFHKMTDMEDGTYRIQVQNYNDKRFKITTQPCWNQACPHSEDFYNDDTLSEGPNAYIYCWLSDRWEGSTRDFSYIKECQSGYGDPVYLYINPTTKKIWAEATSQAITIEDLYIRGPLVDGNWPDADAPASYHKFTKDGDTFTIKLYGSGGGDDEKGKFVLTTGVGEGYRIHNNLFKFKDCHADQNSEYNFVSDLAYDAEEGYVLTISITLVEGKYSLVVAQKTLPVIKTVTDGSRCGTGTVGLSATATAGEGTVKIKWYNVATGGTAFDGTTAPGETWITPSISTTTTYYAEAVDDNFASKERRAVTATVKPTNLIITHEPATVNPYTRVTLTAKNISGVATASNWTITGAGSYFTESDNPTDVSSVVMKPAKDVETTVTATAPVDGCEATGTYTVTPTADTEVCN